MGSVRKVDIFPYCRRDRKDTFLGVVDEGKACHCAVGTREGMVAGHEDQVGRANPFRRVVEAAHRQPRAYFRCGQVVPQVA